MIPDVWKRQPEPEYEVIRNGTLDRQQVKSEQIPPPPPAPVHPRYANVGIRGRLMNLLCDGGWWSVDRAAKALGLPNRRVNSGFKDAAKAGLIEREFEGLPVGRTTGVPQRYRIPR